nr:hypothetical protein [Streptomyces adustus]
MERPVTRDRGHERVEVGLVHAGEERRGVSEPGIARRQLPRTVKTPRSALSRFSVATASVSTGQSGSLRKAGFAIACSSVADTMI